ncbi:NADH-quinone oxidoreductase subunit NuoK [Thermoleophilia bacterium SCSIO 60948]|nr:NADH-quinone oxidoreductase subunit NuoK [Thermoleophilia bacterium SCSIO 60948]
MSLPVILVVAALLFAVGVYGVLGQTNAVMVIMGVELMLGAAMLNVVGFMRYAYPEATGGAFFVLILMTLMALEAAIGFGLVIATFRNRRTAEIDDLADLKG